MLLWKTHSALWHVLLNCDYSHAYSRINSSRVSAPKAFDQRRITTQSCNPRITATTPYDAIRSTQKIPISSAALHGASRLVDEDSGFRVGRIDMKGQCYLEI
ncbi:hypothetical protein F5Y16DRAFT_360582 [Xylariaceae sp. FL0255]|nr:hypothetical protein F5Y16DRAFT_360582 [Xylariaceae sp. FL0255]